MKFVTGVLLASFCCSALADPLNAPPSPQAQTLLSEIRRGGEKAGSCNSNAPSWDINFEGNCIRFAQLANERTHSTDHFTFDTGLYFRGWFDAHWLAIIAAKSSGLIDPAAARAAEPIYWRAYTLAARQSGATDQQVIEALGMTKAALADVEAARAKSSE